jgi:hypothetical protein
LGGGYGAGKSLAPLCKAPSASVVGCWRCHLHRYLAKPSGLSAFRVLGVSPSSPLAIFFFLLPGLSVGSPVKTGCCVQQIDPFRHGDHQSPQRPAVKAARSAPRSGCLDGIGERRAYPSPQDGKGSCLGCRCGWLLAAVWLFVVALRFVGAALMIIDRLGID